MGLTRSYAVLLAALFTFAAWTVPCRATITGVEEIRLTDLSGTQYFSVLEVQAFDAGINIAHTAQGAVATASSNGFGGTPDGAIDGNAAAGCCGQLWHGNNTNAVLSIALPAASDLHKINFFGRQGCCPERADNFQLQLFDGGGNELFSQQVVNAGTASAGGVPFEIPLGAQGPNTPFAVDLQNATATFHQGNFGNVGQTIDGNAESGGMGFFNNRTSNTVVAYETEADLEGPGLLTFAITTNQFAGHQLQRFRLSVTDADRAAFADGLPPNGAESPAGDVTAAPGNFVVLLPQTVQSAGGATMTVDANGIITVSGTNPAIDSYTISALSPLANVTGVRLETLPGGDGFVGRSFGAPHNSNGNAVITEFAMGFTPGGPALANAPVELNLRNATATFDQGGAFTIGSTIDGLLHGNNGWGVFGQQSQPQTAVFQTDGPLWAEEFVVELMHGSPFGAHKLQEFRLSYTTDANPTAGDASINWIELTPTQALTSLDGTNATIDLMNNTIMVTGVNTVADNYQIIFDDALRGATGFRLEAFTGPNGTLGFDGSNGNIVLSEFRVFAVQVPEPTSAALLGLAGLAITARRRRARLGRA